MITITDKKNKNIYQFLSKFKTDDFWNKLSDDFKYNILKEFNKSWIHKHKDINFFFNHITGEFFISNDYFCPISLSVPRKNVSGNFIRFNINLKRLVRSKILSKYIINKNNKIIYKGLLLDDFLVFCKTTLHKNLLNHTKSLIEENLLSKKPYIHLYTKSIVIQEADIYQKVYFYAKCLQKPIEENMYKKEYIISAANYILKQEYNINHIEYIQILSDPIFIWLLKFYLNDKEAIDAFSDVFYILINKHKSTDITNLLFAIYKDFKEIICKYKNITDLKKAYLPNNKIKKIFSCLKLEDFCSDYYFVDIRNFCDFFNKDNYYIFNINNYHNFEKIKDAYQPSIHNIYYPKLNIKLHNSDVKTYIKKLPNNVKNLYIYKEDYETFCKILNDNEYSIYFPEKVNIIFIDDLDENTKDRFI